MNVGNVKSFMNKPLLAIATVKEPTYSETFIKGQIESLKPELVLAGRPVAQTTFPGGEFSYPDYVWSGLLRAPSVLRASLGQSAGREKVKKAVSIVQSRIVEKRLRRFGIDVVLANFGPCAVGLLDCCKRLKVPLVAHFHGYDAHGVVEVDYYRDRYRELGRSAAVVIAVSDHMRDALVHIGMPREKIRVLRCGVDTKKFSPKFDRAAANRFLSVGRFTEKKAPYLVLLAFAEVIKNWPAAKLIMIGDGHHDEVVRNIASSMCPPDSVEILGRAEPQRVVTEMQNATALIQHSICPRHGRSAGDCEGTPVVVLEAMACGLPVIGTRHAGIGEVVEGGASGILVDERDVAGTAMAMLRLLEDPELVAAMGRRGRQLAEAHYSKIQYHNSLREVIAEAVLSRGST
jgi:colanic acid/amylovoran biosynthesis glycosyltransferase